MKSIGNVVVVLTLGCLTSATGALAAEQDWQQAMLHNPSAAQLEMERRGRVFIYDGLDDV